MEPPAQAAVTSRAPPSPGLFSAAAPAPGLRHQQAQHGAGGVGVPEPEPAGGRLGGGASLRRRDGQTLAPPPRVPAPQRRGPDPRRLHGGGGGGRRLGVRGPQPAAAAACLFLHGLGQSRLPRVPVPSKGYG